MTKVYAAPKSIKAPAFEDFYGKGKSDSDGYRKASAKYLSEVQAYARKNGSGKNRGKLVQFGVADGYATYVILSSKPSALIHIDTDDGYQFPYIQRLTAADINKHVSMAESFLRI